jgi:hypothetical protein
LRPDGKAPRSLADGIRWYAFRDGHREEWLALGVEVGPYGIQRAIRRHSDRWPESLLAVRGWLEPWVMLWRYWRAFCDLSPPPELRALLEQVFSGRELYLYVR